MKICLAGILPNSNVNGTGLRKVLFSQGCSHHCEGCFNKHTWEFNQGKSFDCDQLIDDILDETYLAGVTFSGGDPFQQSEPFAYIAKKLKQNNVNIWCYTGYTYEQLIKLANTNIHVKTLLENIDILVDGPFIKSLADQKLLFRGSSNQKIIMVKESMQANSIVLWKNNE